MFRRNSLALILLLIASLLMACSGGSPAPAPTSTSAPTASSVSNATPAAEGTTSNADTIRFELATKGIEARYRVREQLASLALPSDAVGVTSAITGALVLNADGTVVSDESKFVVDITGLTSDRSMRDHYLQSNILKTGTYPTVEFVPKQVMGLSSPLPTSGNVTFQLVGDLTIMGFTRSITWEVTGTTTDGRDFNGTATTHFTFEDFGISQPRVPTVLSVQDNIQLEFDFHFVRAE